MGKNVHRCLIPKNNALILSSLRKKVNHQIHRRADQVQATIAFAQRAIKLVLGGLVEIGLAVSNRGLFVPGGSNRVLYDGQLDMMGKAGRLTMLNTNAGCRPESNPLDSRSWNFNRSI